MSQKAKEMKRGFAPLETITERKFLRGLTPLECCSCNKENPLSNGVISKSHFSAKRRSQFLTGFTLIEIIVAMVIIGILAAGIFATVSFSKRVAVRAQQRTIAMSKIESLLSELKNIGAEELEVLGDVTSIPVGAQAQVQAQGSDPYICPTDLRSAIYCKEIRELNGRLRGIVRAKVSKPATDFAEIEVKAEWIDPIFPDAPPRVEYAYTTVFKE